MRMKQATAWLWQRLARVVNRQGLVLLAQESALTVLLILISVDVQPDGTVRLDRWPLGVVVLVWWSLVVSLCPCYQDRLPPVLRVEVSGWRRWSFQVYSLLWMSLLAAGTSVIWAFALAGIIETCLASICGVVQGWKQAEKKKEAAQARQVPWQPILWPAALLDALPVNTNPPRYWVGCRFCASEVALTAAEREVVRQALVAAGEDVEEDCIAICDACAEAMDLSPTLTALGYPD